MDVRFQGNGLAIATVENVLLVSWPGSFDAAHLDVVEREASQLASRHRRGVGHCNVIGATQVADTPPAPLRARLGAILREPTYAVVSSAIVYQGTGFAAAAMRGVVASVMMLAGASSKLHIVATNDAADTWLRAALERAGAGVPSPGTIGRAAEQLAARGPD
jgi:hypothetical protein